VDKKTGLRQNGSMKTTPQTQLRVPAQGRFLPLVQGHVRDLARAIGLPDRDVLALELAAEEAFENICTHAYPDGTPGDVLVDGELLAGELRLAFHDEGLPFDPALLERRGAKPEGETSGLGLKLIHNAVDEVRWVNRGRQGKALCLVKRLPQAEGAESSVPDRPGEAAELPRAPEQPYEVRPIRADEALQVARLFWLAYGYSYKNEAFYRPEGLLDLVARGVLNSYVAVTQEGEVVGHAGLLRPEPVPTAEMALLVVSPAHRGRKIMERFFDSLVARAAAMGLAGLSLNPVTSHPVSQRQSIDAGGKPCGLDLAACPPRQFKGMRMEDGPPRRESYLHCFKYFSAPPPALAHVPERHRGMVERIYESLGRELTLGQPAQNVSDGLPGAYSVSFDRGLAKGVLRVAVADGQQWPEIRRAATDLLAIAGAEVVHLELPLAQAATPMLWELAEAAGFFFTGVWPHAAEDGDLARLTRLAAPLDMALLRLHSDSALELGAYVGAEMARAAGAGGGVL
jgi:anti-sigma regulatory factor (Ser/Thr protein kinase)/GNAT superfamily N-acetyltransferase